MKAARLVLLLALLAACGGGGGGGRPVAADGALPSGKGEKRGLVLVEGEPEQTPSDASGDGTTTPEIVKSVEADKL